VYDITNTPNAHANEAIKTLNRFTRDTFGLGGIFHGAVEVNGEEWSFGAPRPRRPWRQGGSKHSQMARCVLAQPSRGRVLPPRRRRRTTSPSPAPV
jgi:hypothetical protein